jgi:hypothetical protein
MHVQHAKTMREARTQSNGAHRRSEEDRLVMSLPSGDTTATAERPWRTRCCIARNVGVLISTQLGSLPCPRKPVGTRFVTG